MVLVLVFMVSVVMVSVVVVMLSVVTMESAVGMMSVVVLSSLVREEWVSLVMVDVGCCRVSDVGGVVVLMVTAMMVVR